MMALFKGFPGDQKNEKLPARRPHDQNSGTLAEVFSIAGGAHDGGASGFRCRPALQAEFIHFIKQRFVIDFEHDRRLFPVPAGGVQCGENGLGLGLVLGFGHAHQNGRRVRRFNRSR